MIENFTLIVGPYI